MPSKAPSPGDPIGLPSGLVVQVPSQAARARPWAAVGAGSVWHVCGRWVGDQRLVFFSDQTSGPPLPLDEEDARMLAKILNTVR